MDTAKKILLLTSDPATENAVRFVLTNPRFGQATALATCGRLSELELEVSRNRPGLVLLDVDVEHKAVMTALGRLAGIVPQARSIVLCSVLTTDLALEAMQAGARHCIEKRSLAEELPKVLERFLAGAEHGLGADGKLITVLSAAGGCGATTLAVTLADEGGRDLGRPALLADLDPCFGGVAPHLGIEARYGIADVLNSDGHMDVGLVTSTAMVYGEILHVLVSPACVDFEDPAKTTWSDVTTALRTFRQAYGLTVLDAPRLSLDNMASLASGSDLALIVFETDVVSVRTARALRSALCNRGVATQNLLPVATRYHKRRSMLSLGAIHEAMGVSEIATVRNDYESASRSINLGRPLAEVASRSVIRRDAQALLERLMVADGKHAR